MIMMCQCRFVAGKNCIILAVTLIVVESVHVWGHGVYRKSLYLPLNVIVNLKLLLKKKSKKKKRIKAKYLLL